MYSNLADYYLYVWKQVSSCDVSVDALSFLEGVLQQAYQQNRYSKPMPWIGMYIALASLFCIFAMVADLIHGFRNRKLWFPCKYFTLNAASLTIIAVAMKLPVDLYTPMPAFVDQGAKLVSIAFLCTMTANFLPSIATMDNKELVTNIVALHILVITLLVNSCIEMKTGVVNRYLYRFLAIVYVAMLLMLLIIQTCSALTILKSKQILELKYQAGHETALKDLAMQQPGRLLTVEKLKQHVSNYWIMAETGNPQFITACSATSAASGVICVLSTALCAYTVISSFSFKYVWTSQTDYKWSMSVILVIQFFGVIVGTIAPLFRCFAAVSFKLSKKWIGNHIKVFKVESYWTQKLCDWKQSSIPFSISSRKTRILFQFFKILVLNLCIAFQWTVVVACKMIMLVPIFFVICVLLYIRCLKWLNAKFSGSGTVLDNRPSHNDSSIDLSRYVLQHQDDMEVAERTLKKISSSVNRVLKKSEKKQPFNLIKLLKESKGFEGVGKYDSYDVPSLLSGEPLNCWSLPVVTLTSIAISLPNNQNKRVDSLLTTVNEGLLYVTLVEEILNGTDDYIILRKAAKKLWLEVEVDHKWLENKLRNLSPGVDTAGKILQWWKDMAKNMVTDTYSGSPNDDSLYKSICADSMYRITETILLSYNTNIDEVSQEELFMLISSMIATIFSACLTNLPKVIAIKCHESAIEKREESVHAVAQLLGDTTQIINSLQECELPNLNTDELPFIDKWRSYFKHPSP